jgi:hypothetical protein
MPAGLNLHRLDRLVDAVQANCHIADASHAADLTLCIYLLQMREFFRWEQGIAPMQPLPRDELGAWIARREALWESVEGSTFAPLQVLGCNFDPFDAAAVNAALRPFGLVYGAGYTAPGRACFLLGELQRAEARDGLDLLVSGCEHARGLAAPPAVLAGSTVLLRQESVARWVWEKFEAWTLKRQPGAFRAALDAHGFGAMGSVAVERLIDAEAETLILHELGEHRAGRLLGPEWHDLRARAPRRTDLWLRSMRDHLADCLVTLPTLLARRADASIHFWFSNLEGVRAELFPQLALAYAAWVAGDGGAALRDATSAGTAHWGRACLAVLRLHRAGGPDAASCIDACAVSPQWVLR